jgi:MFS family permease
MASSSTNMDTESQKQTSKVDAAMVGEALQMTEEEATTMVKHSVEVPQTYKVLGLNVYPYSHPRVQAVMLGCVLFLTVGMYNVITFLGGAGQQTAYLSAVANISLYTVFTVFCLVSPACLNYFGLRATLCFGGFGYAAYAASLWCFNHTQNTGFVIFGGCWCGLSAAFLWVAEGTAITAFASEELKGFYVAIFWSIFQAGVVIGAAIPVGQNWNNTGSGTVTDGTYVGLFILMLIGSGLGLCLYPWQKMVREDGSRVTLPRHKNFWDELIASYHVFRKNLWILYFWPMCWAVNYYTIYQSNYFNGVVFSVRGRALNTFLFGLVQIPAAWFLNVFTDKLPCSRRWRAFWAALMIFTMFNAVWIGGYFAMAQTDMDLPESQRLDVYDDGYGKWCFLFVMYGFMDAVYNCYAYWLIGSFSNDPAEVSGRSSWTNCSGLLILTNSSFPFTLRCIDFSTQHAKFVDTLSISKGTQRNSCSALRGL